MKNLIAQIPLSPQGGFKGLGTSPLGNPTGDGVNTFTNFISMAIGLMTLIGIIWFIFIFIIGAIGIISSGGDKNALESAKKKISTGVIGLVVLILAIIIVDFLGYLLGFGVGNIRNFTYLFGLLN